MILKNMVRYQGAIKLWEFILIFLVKEYYELLQCKTHTHAYCLLMYTHTHTHTHTHTLSFETWFRDFVAHEFSLLHWNFGEIQILVLLAT
jgi:hypothetical protein